MCQRCNFDEVVSDVYRALEHPINRRDEQKLNSIRRSIEKYEHVTENQRWQVEQMLVNEEW